MRGYLHLAEEKRENKVLNKTQLQMKEEVLEEISKGVDLDSIRDRAGEWVDSYTPIYTHEIIKAWQDLPSEYDNQGALAFGVSEGIGITGLMQLDLYLYFGDLFSVVLDRVEDELKSQEVCEECANGTEWPCNSCLSEEDRAIKKGATL